MSKYEVIEMIMNSSISDENYKVYLIQSYLLNYTTENDIKEMIDNY